MSKQPSWLSGFRLNRSNSHSLAFMGVLLLLVVFAGLGLACGNSTPTATEAPPSTQTPITMVAPSETPPPPTPTIVGLPVYDAGNPLPPRVIDQQPSAGQEASTEGAVEVTFDQDMDQSATGAALQVSDEQGAKVEGEVSWPEGYILRFTPAKPLRAGSSYLVNLNTKAASKAGMAILEPVSWQFDTVGELQVQQVFPADGATDVESDSSITVIFNRPVVPLVSAEEQADLPSPIEIDPPIQGQGEWINTSVYAFHPDGYMHGGTSYHVVVKAGLADATGDSLLAEDYEWEFTTIAPSFAAYWMTDHEWEVNPYNNYPDVALKQPFAISFYQSMDAESVEANLSIVSGKGELAPLEYSWNDDFTQVVFTPTRRLLYDTKYTLTLNQEAQAVDGGTLLTGLSWKFQTVQTPGIVYTAPSNGEVAASYSSQFYIKFASPMDFNSLKDKVVFTPALESSTNESSYDNWWYDEWGWGMSFYGLQPSTAYEVHILPGMEDVYGTAIKDEVVVHFTTGPYDPSVYLQMPYGPVLYRVGGDQKFYVNYQNIKEVDFELYKLDFETFVGLQNGYLSSWYHPDSQDLVWELTEQSSAGQNQRVLKGFQPTIDGEPLPPGFYFLGIISPQVKRYSSPYNDNRLLMVVTANVTFKNTPTESLAWLTDLTTGAPVSGVPVTVYDGQLEAIGSGVTDENGLFSIGNLPANTNEYNNTYYSRYIMTEEGSSQFAYASNSMDSDVSLYAYGIWSDYYTSPKQPVAYVYTERPIYRPGQPVYYKGILRIDDDLDYALPDASEVVVRIDSYEETVFTGTIPLSEMGTFDSELLLDQEAALGSYTIYVYLPGGRNSIGYVSFNVAEYRKPEFMVEVAAGPKDLHPGETFDVAVQATYYSGGNVSDADVDWMLLADAYTFTPPPELSGYRFSDYESDYGYYNFNYYGSPGSEVIAQGSGKTDSDGRLTLTLPAELSTEGGGRKLTLEATVSDLAGTSVSGRDAVVVHRSAVYPGIRSQRYVGTVGDEQTFLLVAVDWDGNLLPGQSVSVEIVERRWYSVQEQDAQGRIVWTSSVEDIPVTSFEDVKMDEKGKGVVSFTPEKGGIYRAVVTALDDQGNQGRAAAYVWVASEEYIPWRQGNDHGFELVADKDTYAVGDMAELLIASPFQGETYALVTVERGHIKSYEVIKLTSNSTIYRLPITEDMVPNIYVFVTIIKGVDDTSARPDFRIGLAQLNVETAKKTINLELIPDRTQAGPGEQIVYTVRTTDADGKPVSAEVSLSLSDLATLSLSPPNSPAIVDYFYGNRSLSVWTAMPLIYSVEYYNFELAQEEEQGQPAGSGGGKGGEEYGVIEVRENFPDTAYWKARLTTDENGEASVSVTLPDNLTTWRMDGRAVTDNTLVGQAVVDIVSTKPLLVRPQTPRFFVAGDQVIIGTAVHNNTGDDLTVDVTLNGEGISLDGPASQTVDIPAGQRAYVTWNVNVMMDVERVDLVFSAAGGGYSDASRPTLGSLEGQGIPVYRYEVPEVVGTSGMMLEGGTMIEAIVLPTAYEVKQGELDIEVSPSLAAGITSGLNYLEHYPYECIEQTISRFLPNVITTRALKSAGLSDPELEAALETEVNVGLQRIYNLQNPDGGWGWWGDEKSDPLTSAYVILGLVEAKDASYEVSEDVLKNALTYIRTEVRVVNQHTSPSNLNQQAFILYVLARSGNANVSKTVQLYDFRQAIAIYGRAFLTKTLYIIDPEDPRIETLLSDFNNAAILSATGTHWEEAERDYWNWNTDTRTTAIVLSVLSEVDPTNPLNANAARWLMSHRTGDHWWSTQETAWSLMALTNWMVESGELEANYEYGIGLNGEQLGGGVANAETLRDSYELRVDVADLLADQVNRLAFARSDGTGNLYYTAHLKLYLPVEQVEALERGIVVSRSYSPVDSDIAVTEATQGDLLMVRLTIVAPHDLHYVVVEDPLPAGLEAVDQSLLTSPQGVQPESYAYNDFWSHGWGWWYFNHVELRDEKVVLSANYLPAGTYIYTYLVRASTLGTFRVIPPTATEFYFPEVYGRGEGSLFEVKP